MFFLFYLGWSGQLKFFILFYSELNCYGKLYISFSKNIEKILRKWNNYYLKFNNERNNLGKEDTKES